MQPTDSTHAHRDARSTFPTYWAAFLALFVFLQAAAMAIAIPRGKPPDEMAHIAYVRDAANSSLLLPDYANGEILGSKKKNYLTHPPLYYSALATVSKISGRDPVEGYLPLRLLSAAMVAFGFFLWLRTANNFGVGALEATVLTVATCAVPMFGYLAGSINNDNLAYLGVSLCFYGFSRTKLSPATNDFVGVGSIATGMAIVLLAKATAIAFLAAFLVSYCCIMYRDLPSLFHNRMLRIAGFTVLAIAGAWYFASIATFGSPFPSPGTLYALAPPEAPLGVVEFTAKYVVTMWERLPVIMSHAPISPFSNPTWFYLMFLPLLGWVVARPAAARRGASRRAVALGDAFVIAAFCTATLNVLVSYKSYLQTGLFAGWQPRYFSFTLPGIWLLLPLVRPSIRTHALFQAVLAAAACIAFWASVPSTIAKQPAPAGKLTEQLPIELPASRGGIRMTLPARIPRRKAGHVDELRIKGGRVFIRGWAFDGQGGALPRAIWVLDGDRYLGGTFVTLPRPDVAKALGRQDALRTGFAITLLVGPSAKTACSIRVLHVQRNGTVASLQAPSCSPSPR